MIEYSYISSLKNRTLMMVGVVFASGTNAGCVSGNDDDSQDIDGTQTLSISVSTGYLWRVEKAGPQPTSTREGRSKERMRFILR
jgi:hypothetical protein